jgi:hypothetical protein
MGDLPPVPTAGQEPRLQRAAPNAVWNTDWNNVSKSGFENLF